MKRETYIRNIAESDTVWDFIIIGGGATGLGAGVDAAARGYKVLLLEQGDFAEATSSRSTKLVHGGVRYLQQGNIALVMDALHERGLLLQNAPHLVYNQKFLVPDYRWWERPFYGIGMKMYDMLAGKLGFGRSRMLSRSDTLERIPTLQPEGLKGGVIYHDGQFDDARLAITLARTMEDLGGVPVNHCGVTDLIKDDEGVICGVTAKDSLTDTSYEIRAKAVINATGIFVDEIRHMDSPRMAKLVAPSQGIHLILDKSFAPGDTAMMVPHTDDGRVIFMVPWHDRVIVGTTDTPIDTVEMEPKPLKEEIEFLLEHAARYLSKDPKPEDVLSVFTGIRPLIAAESDGKTSSLSRDHHLTISPSGLITIAGGKWTTYRKMGEDTIDNAIRMAGITYRPCATRNLKLHGYSKATDLKDSMHVYGSEIAEIKALAKEFPELDAPMHERLPYKWIEVLWAVRHEMAVNVDDILSRRTRSLLLDAKASLAIAPKVAELMARELGKDAEWEKEQVARYQKLTENYIVR